MGLLPLYLQQLTIQKGVNIYGLRSQEHYLLNIQKVSTNMGKGAFNQLHDKLCFKELVSLN